MGEVAQSRFILNGLSEALSSIATSAGTHACTHTHRHTHTHLNTQHLRGHGGGTLEDASSRSRVLALSWYSPLSKQNQNIHKKILNHPAVISIPSERARQGQPCGCWCPQNCWETPVYTCTPAHTCIYTCTHMHIVHTYVHLHILYIYVCTRIHAHTHAHTCSCRETRCSLGISGGSP